MLALQVQREQAESCSPALQIGVQLLGSLFRKRVRDSLLEKSGCFLQREAQLSRVDFLEIASRPPAHQRQRRRTTRQNHDMEFRRQMLDEEGQRLMDARVLDEMIILQDRQPRRTQFALQQRRRNWLRKNRVTRLARKLSKMPLCKHQGNLIEPLKRQIF